jgi:putative transposase
MSEAAAPTVRKTFKYKLQPTPSHERAMEFVLRRCHELYNAGLEERKVAWEKRRISVNFAIQSAQLPGIKQARPEYRDINAQVLQDVLHRVDRAFQAFFRRVNAGEQPGYPRFQGKDRYDSFTYPQVGEHGGAVLDGSILTLSKIGRIPIRLHRPLQGIPKTVTVSKEADGWYACISCAEVPKQSAALTGRETGIDVGLKVFLITANGEIVENPRHLRRAECYLAKCQRRVTRRRKGSYRRRKAVAVLAKAHQQVRRQRADFHHKTALALVRAYDAIYVEAMQPANLSHRPAPKSAENGTYAHNGAGRKAGLNKSIQDAGWYAFRRILTCKAEWAGKRVEAVNPAYTSQDCSGCGARIQKSLSMRTHVCTTCEVYAGPRRERGPEHPSGRAGPSGANVGGYAVRSLRSPALSGWGACHIASPHSRDTLPNVTVSPGCTPACSSAAVTPRRRKWPSNRAMPSVFSGSVIATSRSMRLPRTR